MALKYGYFQLKEWKKKRNKFHERNSQDKIRLLEADLAGVISNKQPGDSKCTVVWSHQTNER